MLPSAGRKLGAMAMNENHDSGSRLRLPCFGLALALAASIPIQATATDAADEWQEVVARSQAADAERAGVTKTPAAAPAPPPRKSAGRTPGAHNVSARAGSSRAAGSGSATSPQSTPTGQTVEVGAQSDAMQKRDSARRVAGPGITIISGGKSADGAARVGRLPLRR